MTISGTYFQKLLLIKSRFEALFLFPTLFALSRSLRSLHTLHLKEFSKSYKDSEEERGDVIKYYNRYEGDFSSIMDSVMLAEDEDMDRIIAIIRDCLSTGELGSYAICFDQTSSKYVANYKKRLEAERKATATGKPKKSKKQDNSDDLLQQMISNNARRRGGEDSIFADIMSKYSSHAEKGAEKKKAKVYDDISDCDFEATRARVMAKKRKHP